MLELHEGQAIVAACSPDVQLVEIDSDHHVTLRHSEQVDELLLELLTTVAPE
jgi:hypothetical protein